MTEGTLTIKIKKKKSKKNNSVKTQREAKILFTNSNNIYSQKPLYLIAPQEISVALTEKIKPDIKQEIEVEFEEEGDQLKKIREKGTQWDRVGLYVETGRKTAEARIIIIVKLLLFQVI